MNTTELAKICYELFPANRGNKTFEDQDKTWHGRWIEFATKLNARFSLDTQPSLFSSGSYTSKTNLAEARKLPVQQLIQLVEREIGITDTEVLARQLGISVDTLAKYKTGSRPQSVELVKNALIGLLARFYAKC